MSFGLLIVLVCRVLILDSGLSYKVNVYYETDYVKHNVNRHVCANNNRPFDIGRLLISSTIVLTNTITDHF